MNTYHSTFSLSQTIMAWSSRLTSIVILLISLIHFSENPLGVSIISIVFLFIIIIVREDKIIVYEDKVVFKQMYFLNLYVIKKNSFYFKDIKTFDPNNNTNTDKTVNQLTGSKLGSCLWIHLLTGNIISIKSTLNRSNLIEVAEIVNSELQITN